MMNETMTYLIVSAISGVCLAIVKVLYDSKCIHVKCCGGFIDIERDIQTEFKEDEKKNNNN